MSPTPESPPAEASDTGDENLELGLWHTAMEADSLPVIRDQKGNLIATIHGHSLSNRLSRAGLVMSAPAWLDALIGALDVLHHLAEGPPVQARLAARDMIPVLESALAAANMLGTIYQADLIGP